QTTGHASRGLAGSPGVAPHNLTLLPGAQTPAELMAAAGQGLLVTSMFGPSLNANTGDWSAGVSGFWFEGGEIAYPVNEITLAADALLKARLTAARPDYAWLSEETADDRARLHTRRVFVVDPIDGTAAFVKGRPWWSVSLAVVEDGRALSGVIYAPGLEETYEAERGGGARLNGREIGASGAADLEAFAMLGSARSFAGYDGPEPRPVMRVESRHSV